MKKRMLNFPACLVLFFLSVLLLLPISAMAEGNGGWTTTASPGLIFQIQEGLYNNQKHLVMTVIKPDLMGVEFYWGPASGSVGSTYPLGSMNGDSDMVATWRFISHKEATVTVDSCTTNCLWQSGQVVTLNKFFGDTGIDCRNATRVPKTGQSDCWDVDGKPIDCASTGQDGEYQLGVSPVVPPSFDNPYTVYGWEGVRFTDNLDGTVTDNLTGLIWLKNANCFGLRNWPEALSDCNNLENGSCGLTDGSSPGDWRLPNFNELHCTLYGLYDRQHPPKGNEHFINVQKEMFDWYWSSTTSVSDKEVAWDANVAGEGVTAKFWPGRFVWPVRSGN